jgi:hypothetical protein
MGASPNPPPLPPPPSSCASAPAHSLSLPRPQVFLLVCEALNFAHCITSWGVDSVIKWQVSARPTMVPPATRFRVNADAGVSACALWCDRCAMWWGCSPGTGVGSGGTIV